MMVFGLNKKGMLQHMNRDSVLVSIIVPVYNSERFIKENIESILNQSHKCLELILVDDGSDDSSLQLLFNYAKKDQRVKILSQRNQGAPAARNKGFSHSSGDYVYFVDSDDTLSKYAVEYLLESAINTSSQITIGQYDASSDYNGYLGQVNFGFNNSKIYYMEQNNMLAFMQPIPGNKLYLRNFLIEYNIVFDDVKIGQDLNFYLKALGTASRVSVIDKIVYHYRLREGSISNTFSLKILDIVNSIKYVEDYYNKHQIYDKIMFENIKFDHFSRQLAKTPQIPNLKEREKVFKEFKYHINNLHHKLLYKNIYKKYYFKTKLKLILGPLFKSETYARMQRKKNKRQRYITNQSNLM